MSTHHYSRSLIAVAILAIALPGLSLAQEEEGGIFDFGLPRGGGLFGEVEQHPEEEPLRGFQALEEAHRAEPGEEMILLAFNNADIAQVVMRLQELAVRPVNPAPNLMNQPTRITLINSNGLPRKAALNLLIDTLFANRIGVIDRGSHLAVMPLAEITSGMVPILGPEDDILDRQDTGMIVEKVFQIRYTRAQQIAEALRTSLLPTAPNEIKVAVAEDSNQIVALYNVQTLQRFQRLIDKLDVPGGALQMETFLLRYSDAETVAKLIISLFAEDERRGTQQQQALFGGRQPQRGQQEVATTQRITVVAMRQLNAVTVRAERDIIEQVRQQILERWDVPISPDVIRPRIYHLQHSDAVQMRDLLNRIFGPEGEDVTVVEPDFFFGGMGQQQRRQPAPTSREGEHGPRLHRLQGQVSFEADRPKNNLIVTARSVEYYPIIEEIIERLDQPVATNMPIIYELKHAEAEDTAIRLNAMLAEAGIEVPVDRVETGLTRGMRGPRVGAQEAEQQQQADPRTLRMPWQHTQPDREGRLTSGLIGPVRIMPIPRQNALMVLSPPELRESMATLIAALDQPGRQVLIQAIIAEVSVDDAMLLGLRWGSESPSPGVSTDHRVDIRAGFDGVKDDLLRALFDTSVLNVNVDLNAAIQALARLTDVRILSRPKIVTSDNEQAIFFDGQDIPFVTDTVVSELGPVTQSFEYLAVGIQLSVRPQITVEGNVNLRINLELSSVVPGQFLFGGAILDRRETETKVTVLNGQTVVISGITRSQVSDVLRKVPLLGDIPIIGHIFRSRDKSESRSQLVAFVRPIILDSPEMMHEISLPDIDLLRSLEQGFEDERTIRSRHPGGKRPLPGESRPGVGAPQRPREEPPASNPAAARMWWQEAAAAPDGWNE